MFGFAPWFGAVWFVGFLSLLFVGIERSLLGGSIGAAAAAAAAAFSTGGRQNYSGVGRSRQGHGKMVPSFASERRRSNKGMRR